MDDQKNDGYDQQQVDQPTRDVEGAPAQKPGHQQYDKQNEKHKLPLFLLTVFVQAAAGTVPPKARRACQKKSLLAFTP
jgi:hypothetical protein